MNIINKFLQGISNTVDYLLRKPTHWDFPSKNIRIINKTGKGFLVTPLNSNEPGFNLHTGYVPLGSFTYEGISYIASVNPSNGICQVGCYPSPKEWSETNAEFERTYKPLFVLYSGFRKDLTTTLLNFDTDHPVSLIVKPSYDNSVNIYITDGKNPVRVINSGFKITGEMVDRTVKTTDFEGKIDLIPASKYYPYGDNLNIDVGGRLKPGSYYLFIRYLTEEYNSTVFISQYGPIQISQGSYPNNVQGMQEKIWQKDIISFTSKRIELTIKNLDPAYSYFQIGVLRWSADMENGPAGKDTYLIAKKFSINNSEENIFITGYEKQESLSFEQLITPQNPYRINQSHTSIKETYVGVNWKKKNTSYDVTALEEFAKKVYPQPHFSEEIFNESSLVDSIYAHESNYANLHGYLNEERRTTSVGYFRDQIYPFAIVFQFDDNTESEAFPIRGFMDSWNYKGLYKMISWNYPDPDNDQAHALGVKMNLGTALTYYNNNKEKFAGIVGFKIVRGERIDNLLYQGVVMPAFDRIEIMNTLEDGVYGIGMPNGNSKETNLSVPNYKGLLPIMEYKWEDSEFKTVYHGAFDQDLNLPSGSDPSVLEGTNYKSLAMKYYEDGEGIEKLGFFSPDLLFDQNPYTPDEVYVHGQIGIDDKNNLPIYHMKNTSMIQYPLIGVDYSPAAPNVTFSTGFTNQIRVETAFVDKFTREGNHGFTSWLKAKDWLKEGDDVQGGETVPQHYNRTFALCRYLGLINKFGYEINGETNPSFDDEGINYGICNLYRTRNNSDFFADTLNSFNVANTSYSEISDTLYFDKIGSTINLFKGDCFLQKTFFRIGRYYNYEEIYAAWISNDYEGPGNMYLGHNNKLYQWGFLIGIVTENKINTNARNSVKGTDPDGNEVEYDFYPHVLTTGKRVQDWVVESEQYSDQQEAFQVNDGYNKCCSGKEHIGYNPDIPHDPEKEKPNRYYYSAKYIPGSVYDAFRDISIKNYKDFNVNGGPFTAIINFHDVALIGIQHNQIIVNRIEERALSKEEASNALIFGTSITFLSDVYNPISKFGSRHKHGIVVSDHAIYGVDWLKKVLWMITPDGQSLKAINMADAFQIENEIEEYFNLYEEYSDVLNTLKDNPFQGNGILLGYDRKYDEILFTFLFKAKNYSILGDVNRTLVFNERIKAFTCDYDMAPLDYILINEDFYALKKKKGEIEGTYAPTNEYYRQNVPGEFLSFFDDSDNKMQISFIVNGFNEQENISDLVKVFERLYIDMSEDELSTIIYETENQKGSYNFLTREDQSDSNFWKISERNQNKWDIPIVLQTFESTYSEYNINSDLRGRWLKITLSIDPENVSQNTYIRSVITKINMVRS